MFDDLDDLLEDIPQNKNTQKSTKPATSSNLNKVQSAKKKDDDDFSTWDQPTGQLTFGQSKRANSSTQPQVIKKETYSTGTFGGGGGASALGKQNSKKKDESDWGEWEEPEANKSSSVNFGNRGSMAGGKTEIQDGRSSVGSQYAGFGILGKPKPASSNKKKDDDEDLLDNILGDIEQKKGIESKAQPQKQETSSWLGGGGAATQKQQSFQQSKQKFKSNADAWGRETFDELEDMDDAKSKKSQNMANQQNLADKKRALFGIGGGANDDRDDNEGIYGGGRSKNRDIDSRKNQTSKSMGRFADREEESKEMDFYEYGGAAAGNQDSGIDVIETPFSRQNRQPRKIPVQGGGQQRNAISQQRPMTSDQLYSQSQFQQNYQDETSPVNQQQFIMAQQHQQARPNTGGILTGKPPKHTAKEQHFDFHASAGEDDNILGLLGESKDRSVKGSQASGHGGKPYGSIEDESYDSQDEEQKQDEEDEDSDDLGGYVPTALVRTGAKEKPKKQKEKRQTRQQMIANQKSAGGSVKGEKQGMSDMNNSERRAQTITSDGEFKKTKTTIQNTPYTVGANNVNSNLSQPSVSNSQNMSPNFINVQQQPTQPQIDEKTLILQQIEEVRQKYRIVETRNRKEMDEVREDHKKNMKQTEEKQSLKLQLYNEEKRKLIEEMNKTIELEKEKLINLHKIDIDNREVQYRRNLDNQKKLYEEQHGSLKKQLEQQVQLNTFAQEISKSSGNINSLVSKMASEREGEVKRREEDLERREKELIERKKHLAERRFQLEQRKKRVQNELEDVTQRINEEKVQYEREKKEVIREIEDIEGEFQNSIRESRNRQIEMEVDTRKTMTEREKAIMIMESENKEYNDKLEELNQQKRQLQQQKEDLKSEMAQQERELKQKAQQLKETEQEIIYEEREFIVKEQEYDQETKSVQIENERLQEQLDKYCIEKDKFDREAMKVKEQAERDQMDSEKIGFFKANKDRLKDELRQLRSELEVEKDSIKEDRVKLEMFKNELKTRQKTLEGLRFDFIKNNPDSSNKYLDDARDIGYYKIQRQSGNAPSFYPINPPGFADPSRKENMSPNQKLEQARTLIQRSHLAQQETIQNNSNRFNYDEYMRNLKSKLSTSIAGAPIGSSDFQQYLIQERQAYLKSLQELDEPLLMSISQFKNSHRGGADQNHEASFNLGSLTNSVYNDQSKANKKGLVNSQFGKSSANSLHFISKNFSNSPVEEADGQQEESHLHL